jgi:Domain of unknown function DUF29
MGTNKDLYEQDFYAWLQEQARLLKARQFEALDLDNLIEEVEGLARQECHLLHHRLQTLLTHLVAWWGQLPERCVRWEHVIARQRYELQDILADSPSQRDTGLPLVTFPATCPWTVAQALEADFWPEGRRTSYDRHHTLSPQRLPTHPAGISTSRPPLVAGCRPGTVASKRVAIDCVQST